MGRPFLVLRRAATQAKCCCRRRMRKVICSCIRGLGVGKDKFPPPSLRAWLPYSVACVDATMYGEQGFWTTLIIMNDS